MFCLAEKADFQRNLTPVACGPACLDKFRAECLGGASEISLHLRKPDDCLLSGAEHTMICVGRLCSRHDTSFTPGPWCASDHDTTRRHKRRKEKPSPFLYMGNCDDPDAFLPQFKVKPVEFFFSPCVLSRAGALAHGCL